MRSSAARSAGVGGLLLALVLGALLSAFWVGGQVSSATGDPESPAANGSAALVAMLRERAGVQVHVARTTAQALAAGGEQHTLVVFGSTTLSAQARDRLVTAAESDRARTVVLIRPTQELLDDLAPEAWEVGTISGVLRAGCTSEDADAGDEIAAPTRLYRSYDSDTVACFRQSDGATGPEKRSGAILTRTWEGRRLVIVGATSPFLNATLTDLDQAAIGVRLLAHERHLVWFVPSSSEVEAAGTATDPKAWPPLWLGPLTLALAGTVVALMLWRGRRLGRLAVEPLPVVVDAFETTVARGRLYRRAKDPAYAASILQAATRTRLAARLGLPAGADAGAVAHALAGSTHPDAALALLTRTVTTNAELTRLAAELSALEKEVRRT